MIIRITIENFSSRLAPKIGRGEVITASVSRRGGIEVQTPSNFRRDNSLATALAPVLAETMHRMIGDGFIDAMNAQDNRDVLPR